MQRPLTAPEAVQLPQGWRWGRLSEHFRHIDERSTTGSELLLSITKSKGVVPRHRITDRPARADTLVGYKKCRAGDFIVNQMSAFDGLMGVTSWDGIVTYHYLVFRPVGQINTRFMAYLLRSPAYKHDFACRVRGLGDSSQKGVRTPHIRIGDMLQTMLALPPQTTQRAIADYLDAETARIDALIAKKRRLRDQVSAAFVAWREKEMVLRGGVRWVPLMHLTDPHRPIVYGIVQAGEEVPHGVPYIKTGDLNDLRPEVLSRTSREIDQAYRRARVCPGDIVMAMRASIGLCVVVPESLPRANLTQGTARIAPADGIPVRWLYHALGTHAVQERCDLEAVGTTFRTLNIWSLRRIPIPVVDTDHLAETAARMDEREHATERTLRTMDEQVDLLVEHRQALITAAVTGELEVAA